ncbi:MAG: HAMP domain-containing histidine kinase [Clostridia bacterium]|nr:HAMP domain-containing histidine kinase [Clostridia bacterium]
MGKSKGILKTLMVFNFILLYGVVLQSYTPLKYMLLVLITLSIIGFSLYDIQQKKSFEKSLEQITDKIIQMKNHPNEIFRSALEDNTFSRLQFEINAFSEQLKDLYEKEQQSKKQIVALIGNISHQIRTPLSNLEIYFELAANASQDEIQVYMKKMNPQLRKLEFLIESLIKLSKLETGAIQIQPENTSLNALLLEAINMVHLKALEKNIDIQYLITENLHGLVDPKWTIEAIFNILDNAVKYSPKDSTIVIQRESREMYESIRITDFGIGIPKEDYHKIFKRFYRSEKSKNYTGVGIGLYLAQEIFLKQRGFITVKSSLNKGSTFYLNFKKIE